jgi:hypothetical protein
MAYFMSFFQEIVLKKDLVSEEDYKDENRETDDQ